MALLTTLFFSFSDNFLSFQSYSLLGFSHTFWMPWLGFPCRLTTSHCLNIEASQCSTDSSYSKDLLWLISFVLTSSTSDLQSMTPKSISIGQRFIRTLRSTYPKTWFFTVMSYRHLNWSYPKVNANNFSPHLNLTVIRATNWDLFYTFPRSSTSLSNRLSLLYSSWICSFLFIIFIITIVQSVAITLPEYPMSLLPTFSVSISLSSIPYPHNCKGDFLKCKNDDVTFYLTVFRGFSFPSGYPRERFKICPSGFTSCHTNTLRRVGGSVLSGLCGLHAVFAQLRMPPDSLLNIFKCCMKTLITWENLFRWFSWKLCLSIILILPSAFLGNW